MRARQDLDYLLPAPGIDHNLVYGIFNDVLVFIPKDRAIFLAAVHRALIESSTWGQFAQSVPKAIFELALAQLDENTPTGEQNIFSPEQIGGWSDGTFLPWPAQDMLKWIPADVQKQFGVARASLHNGLFLDLQKRRDAEIVASLESHGFECKRDETLVACACGLVLEEG